MDTQNPGDCNSPLWSDAGARADVVLGGEHKLVVEHPVRLVVQHSGGVQLDHLVVLHRQVLACALQVRHLSQRSHVITRNRLIYGNI